MHATELMKNLYNKFAKKYVPCWKLKKKQAYVQKNSRKRVENFYRKLHRCYLHVKKTSMFVNQFAKRAAKPLESSEARSGFFANFPRINEDFSPSKFANRVILAKHVLVVPRPGQTMRDYDNFGANKTTPFALRAEFAL